MDVAQLSQLRPRNVWDIADDAFDLYRERFATLAGISAVAFVPAHLLNTWITTVAYARLSASQASGEAAGMIVPLLIFFGATLAGQPVLLLAQAVQSAATARAVERRLSGDLVTGGSVWRELRPRLASVALAGLLGGLATTLASGATLGLAWLLLAPLWAFVPISIAVEKTGIAAGFRRSKALAGSSFWRVLGLLALLYFLEVGLQFGLSALLQLGLLTIPGAAQKADSTATFVGSQGATAVASLFLSPLKAIAVSLLYFDTRVRKEGLDIIALANETGVTLAEAPE